MRVNLTNGTGVAAEPDHHMNDADDNHGNSNDNYYDDDKNEHICASLCQVSAY